MEEEQAKEELEMLEALYPNQYEYLKDELRSLIFQLQSKNHDSQLLPDNNHTTNFIAFLDTEESTSLEHRKSSDYALELELAERVVMEAKIDESPEPDSPIVVMKPNSNRSRKNKRKDRVDLVLERAQTCLKKIRHLKTSLLYPS